MRVGIGISAGSEVVCAALITVEADGSRTVEYRTVSADAEANTDIGDLVTSAIDLMVSLSPSPPDSRAIAVAYRTADQASSIRSACARSKRRAMLVSESEAAYAFLDDSGLIARYRSVALVDIGARGTTTSIIDVASGELQTDHRADDFGGDVMNTLVKGLIANSPTSSKAAREDSLGDRGFVTTRYRAVKEYLSTHDTAVVSGADESSTITRAGLEELARPYVSSAAQCARRTAASAPIAPEAVVLTGGGANIPLARIEYGTALAVPVIDVAEPDTVLAKGAAHLALNATSDDYPAVGSNRETHSRSMGRFSGALVGAFVVGGLVLAYGIQTLSPTADPTFSPAGSNAPNAVGDDQVEAVGGLPADAAAKTPRPGTSTAEAPAQSGFQSSTAALESASATSTIRPTPLLHPAPDLSLVPWPAEPSDFSGPDTATVQADDPPTTLPVITFPPPPPLLLTTLPPAPVPTWTTPPDGAPEAPPTDAPGETSTPAPPAAEEPADVPQDSTAVVPQSTPSEPSSDVMTPPSPVLTPPATVWSPPLRDSTADAAAAEVPQPSSTPLSTAPPSTTSPISPSE